MAKKTTEVYTTRIGMYTEKKYFNIKKFVYFKKSAKLSTYSNALVICELGRNLNRSSLVYFAPHNWAKRNSEIIETLSLKKII